METIGVSILSGIGELTVQKLDAFLSQEAQLLCGIRDDLQFIKDEVESATAFLKDMSSQSFIENRSSEQLMQWLKQTKDFIYEAEDVLDEYKYHTVRRGNKCHLLRRLKYLKAHRHIASDLKKLKLKGKDLKERRERYNVSAGLVVHFLGANARHVTSSMDPRLREHYVREDKLVGMASQRDVIIKWLVKDNMPQLRVISVVGPGGMGKTTLATHSYQNPKVDNGQFSCRAHIIVSLNFNFNTVMKSLIKQLFTGDFEALTVEELVTSISERLRNKRYLVLLDDVWTVDAWNALSCAFPDKGNGSRIIVTTRNDAVANTCSSRDPQYVLRIQPLPHEESKELLCKRVFLVPPFSCPPYLEELMEGILKQCGGMPLAIVTIAGILVSNKQTKEHWQRVHDHIGPEWEDGVKNMRRILMLSCNDLPYDIKPCFLYLSMIPENMQFKCSEIVRRWIAEGLVSGVDVEQLGKSYFDELANRNLIAPAIIRCGEVKRWKIHDLILEIIVGKAVDGNFVYIKNKTPQGSKIRRISVRGEVSTLKGLDLSLARSLSLRYALDGMRESKMLNFNKMRLLRMLDLEGCHFIDDQHIQHICDTSLLLKHLSLRSTRVSKLPQSIEMLKDLEVLDIRNTFIKKLPRSLIKLKQLSHLYTGKMHAEEIIKLGNMESLRVLKARSEALDIEVLKALGRQVNLEELDIACNNKRGKHPPEIWKRMFLQTLKDLGDSSLRSLTIFSSYLGVQFTGDDLLPPSKLDTLKLGGKFIREGVPKWVQSLHHVTKVSLQYIEFQQDDIRLLGSLPSLVILHLRSRPSQIFLYLLGQHRPGCEHYIGPEGFPNLKSLLIIFGYHFPNITFRKGALSSLEFLHLEQFTKPELAGNILGIENLLKLKEYHLRTSLLKSQSG